MTIDIPTPDIEDSWTPVVGWLVAWTAVTVESITSCDAMTKQNIRANRLFGQNNEVILLSEEGTGVLRVDNMKFPRGFHISWRNILVTEYWDGSVRIERVQSADKFSETPDWGWTSDRLIGSSLLTQAKGTLYLNHVVVFNKNWGMIIIDEV